MERNTSGIGIANLGCLRRFGSAVGLLAALVAWAPPSMAAPIRYTLSFDTYFVNPAIAEALQFSVMLGGVTYTDTGLSVVLSFVGDDSNVHSGFTPLSFSEIHEGVATVSLLEGATVIRTATILPNQIAVTADHANDGFGFGFVPGGIGPGPLDLALLQPIYPAAISPTFVGDPYPDASYDLTLQYAIDHAGQSGTGFNYGADGSATLRAGLWSCDGFNGHFGSGCSFPASNIGTDQGGFSIVGDIQPWYALFRGALPIGTFTAQPLSTVAEPGSLALAGLALAFAVSLRVRHPTRRTGRRSERS